MNGLAHVEDEHSADAFRGYSQSENPTPPHHPRAVRTLKEPRYPYQFSTARSSDLLQLPYQAQALQSFVRTAQRQQSIPSGHFSSASSASSSEDEGPAVLAVGSRAAAGDSIDQHSSLGPGSFDRSCADGANHESVSKSTNHTHHRVARMNESTARRPRRISDAASINTQQTKASVQTQQKNGSSYVEAACEVQDGAENYIAMVTERLKRANPSLPEHELRLLIVKTAQETYLRALKSEKIRQMKADKAAEQALASQSQNDAGIHNTAGGSAEYKHATDSPSPKDSEDLWGRPGQLTTSYKKPKKMSSMASTYSSDSDVDDADDGVEVSSVHTPTARSATNASQGFSRVSRIPASIDSSTSGTATAVNVDRDNSQANFEPAPAIVDYVPDKPANGNAYESSSDDEPGASNIANIPRRQMMVTGAAKRWVHIWACNFEGCGFSCKKKSELINHKVNEHFVCVPCDEEFRTNDQLLLHKQESSAHNCCWVCGKDFFTQSTRDRHMEAYHPLNKGLTCPGCAVPFANQTAFITHLEAKACLNITSEQFQKARQMVGKLNDVEVIEEGKDDEQPDKKAQVKGKAAEKAYESEPPNFMDDDHGLLGLSLSSTKTINQFPGLNLPQKEKPFDINEHSTFIKKLKSMTLGDTMSSVKLGPSEARLYNLYRRMVGPANSDLDVPRSPDGEPLKEARVDGPAFNPGLFYVKMIGAYVCPFFFCKKRCKTEQALEMHLRSPAHKNTDLRCPECNDSFKTATALIGHMEAPSRNCNIRNSEMYKEALEVASGTFLSTELDRANGRQKVVVQPVRW